MSTNEQKAITKKTVKPSEKTVKAKTINKSKKLINKDETIESNIEINSLNEITVSTNNTNEELKKINGKSLIKELKKEIKKDKQKIKEIKNIIKKEKKNSEIKKKK